MKCKRILAVSSGGGHWVQLLRLRSAFDGHEVTYVTVRQEYRADVGNEPFRVISDATRWNKFGLICMALQIAWILLCVRPDVVISTGAAPGYFALRLGKLVGAHTVWLDSMANVDHLSLSGERIKPYADLMLTQWPHLAQPDGPLYEGAVL
jgi:UDP-N-acetylglucosamine:LPS N-acetylglucosamine transferase